MFTSSYSDKFICKYKGKANWFHSENKNTHINVAVVTDGLNHLNLENAMLKKNNSNMYIVCLVVLYLSFLWLCNKL